MPSGVTFARTARRSSRQLPRFTSPSASRRSTSWVTFDRTQRSWPEVSQGHRLAGTDELLHGVELRDGEPYRDKRLLEALPELFRRSEHGHERALVRAGPDGALRL